MRTIRVGVIEDVEEMRELFTVLLEEVASVSLAWVASSVQEARREMSRERVDLVFLDEVIPGEMSGAFVPELQAQGTKVILITGSESALGRPVPLGVLARLPKPSWETLPRDRPAYIRMIRSHDWSAKG